MQNLFIWVNLGYIYLEKNFNLEWGFLLLRRNTTISQNGFLCNTFHPQITKNGRRCCWGPETNSQRPHVQTAGASTGGETKMPDDEIQMGKLSPTWPGCPRLGPQCRPPLPWVPPATTTICSLLRCKRGSPRRLERAPSGPPCEICACLHYYYFLLETTNYFIFSLSPYKYKPWSYPNPR